MTKSRIQHTAIIEIDSAIIRSRFVKDVKALIEDLDTLQRQVGAFQLDTNLAKLVITDFARGNFRFCISEFKNENAFNFVLYDLRGAVQVASVWFEAHQAEEAWAKAWAKAKAWQDGIYHCNGCGSQIDSETHNSFLAGSYCDSCWEGFYKEQKEFYGC